MKKSMAIVLAVLVVLCAGLAAVLGGRLNAANQEVTALTAERDQLTASQQKLPSEQDAEASASAERSAALEGDAAALAAQLEASGAEAEAARQEIAALNDRINALNDDMAAIQQELTAAQAELEDTRTVSGTVPGLENSLSEAKAELGQCTEEVWNASVKLVRERAGVKSIYPTTADPYMMAYFPGVTDPKILEIRRERGIEFTMENLRQQDIRRWHMGELLVKQKTGMWIPAIETELDLDEDGVVDNMVSAKLTEKAGIKVLTINYNGSTLSGTDHRLSEGDHGYILPYQANRAQYNWSEKKYLYPVPASSVTLNENLDQNAGW